MTSTDEMMHRWSQDHPLPVHVTDGHLKAFMLISPIKPPAVKQSKAVSVIVEPHGEQWKLEFRLNEPRYAPMFKSFYEDVYENTWTTDVGHAAVKFVEIYKKWKRAFSSEGLPLSREEVQGLIGEMVTIRDTLLKLYSPKKILDSWMITQKGKQDFILGDTWYEVKSTHVGNNHVIISSIEQLDTDSIGHLIVVKLNSTSTTSDRKLTLGSIVNELQALFDENDCGEEFLAKVSEMGLPSDRYEDQAYEIVEMEQYEVGVVFPCLRRSELPPAVGSITYELYLDAIREHKEC